MQIVQDVTSTEFSRRMGKKLVLSCPYSESLDLGSGRPDLGSEWPDLGSGRPDLGSERPFLRLGRGGRDGNRKKLPYVES